MPNQELENLIQDIIKSGYLKTPRIIEAFRKIDRKDFVPAELEGQAYLNSAMPIGWGQTISQPLTVAFMLELLQPEQGQKILDIGSGSGWQTALLAELVGDKGKIFAIERILELCRFGQTNIAKYDFIKSGRVQWLCQDGSRGLPDEAPFDRIIAAAAAERLPEQWFEQLSSEGGRLVVPVKGSIWLVIRHGPDQFEKEEYPGFAFVPLIEADQRG